MVMLGHVGVVNGGVGCDVWIWWCTVRWCVVRFGGMGI